MVLSHTPPAVDLATLRALLVSLDPRVIATLSNSLHRLGISSDICHDVTTAIQKLHKAKYEAVFVDFQISTDATSVLEHLRHSKANQRSVAFAIIGEDMTVANANFTIRRPVVAATVSRVIRAAYGLMLRERRRYFRCPVNIPARLSSGGTDVSCTVLNVSEGGMAFRSPVLLKSGDRAKLECRLSGGPSVSLAVEGEIRWFSEDGRVGLVFLRMPPKHLHDLQLWLAARLEEHLPESISQSFGSGEK